MAPSIQARSCSEYADDGTCSSSSDDFWWSSEGYGIRYAVVALIFAFIVLLLFLSYFHANRRIRKGLPPLRYHRWLVSRRQYHRYPPQNSYVVYNAGGGVPMEPMGGQQGHAQYAPPPPAYGQWDAPPPVYQPPRGATKADPEQNFGGVGARAEEVGEGSRTQGQAGRA